MKIIVGHSNMDLDCLGSMILAKKLFPDHRLVKSRLIHPVARNLYNLYQNHFDFLNVRDLKGETLEAVKVVDTASWQRIKEYFSPEDLEGAEIDVYDHHPREVLDIPGATLHHAPYGANTTTLGVRIREEGIPLEPEEATIALTGIYADTGRFIYDNVRREDFEVSSFLVKQGASLKLVKEFISPLREEFQRELLHGLFSHLTREEIKGYSLLFSYWELEENTPGLAAVVDNLMDVEGPDAYFAVFAIPREERVLLIARSQNDRINLQEILPEYGGGGHLKAGSAKIRCSDGREFLKTLKEGLGQKLAPAPRARDIMTARVLTVRQENTLLEASLYLEEVDHSGVPVVDHQDRAVGFLSLRDIMKGRRGAQMHAPVKAYMTRKLVWASPQATVRDIGKAFYDNHIGHLPILIDQRVVGIVTRWDYLQFQRKSSVL